LQRTVHHLLQHWHCVSTVAPHRTTHHIGERLCRTRPNR
jgi:hypothetical protein